MAPPEFKSGTRAEVASGAAQYETGAIFTELTPTKVGQGTGQGGSTGNTLRHRAVVYSKRDSSGRITGSERVIYTLGKKPGGGQQWEPAAISLDGGETYQFSSDRFPTMENVASQDLIKDLSNTNERSQIEKDIDDAIKKQIDKRPDVLPSDRDTLIASGVNDAITEAEESVQDGSVDTQSTDANEPSNTLSIETPEREGTRSNFGDSIYPLDLGVTGQDVLKFSMLKYVPSDIQSDGVFGIINETRNQGERDILGTVILPIPGGIQDSNNVNWNSQSMNAAEAAMADIALRTIQSGGEGLTQSITDVAKTITGNKGDVISATAAAFAGAASGVGAQLLTRTTGAVINPNLELLFGGPLLRQFSFRFMLTPREAAESQEIVRILRFFKQGSAVQRTASNLFLKSPHTFRIQYLYRGPGDENNNPFMNKIKECACTGVNVNYTPQNNYSTFPDGAMTSYELTLNFNELEPVFNDEYQNDNDASIGF
tara:strand:- start:196 stop:1650 length:1455 start_codon:yes stop_codon:yes gene_type:complete